MASKRAPGGGRKPISSTAARAQLSVRMPDELRTELEEEAARRGHSLTQEMLGRLKDSLVRERVDRRDEPMRALCFLFQEVVERIPFDLPFNKERNRAPQKWYRDPFTFETFKLAIPKILDGLHPPGEVISPYAALPVDKLEAKPGLKLLAERYKTPEDVATWIATGVLESLFRPRRVTSQDETQIMRWRRPQPKLEEFIEQLKREYFAMERAGRALGVNQSPVVGVVDAWEDMRRKQKVPRQ